MINTKFLFLNPRLSNWIMYVLFHAHLNKFFAFEKKNAHTHAQKYNLSEYVDWIAYCAQLGYQFPIWKKSEK